MDDCFLVIPVGMLLVGAGLLMRRYSADLGRHVLSFRMPRWIDDTNRHPVDGKPLVEQIYFYFGTFAAGFAAVVTAYHLVRCIVS